MQRETSLGTFGVPDGWSDESVLRFFAPAPESADVALQAEPALVSATFARVLAPHGPEKLLEQMGDALARGLPGAALESREPWEHPEHGKLPTLEYSHDFRPSQRLRQALVCLPSTRGAAVVATFAAPERSFEQERGQFLEILRSFHPTR